MAEAKQRRPRRTHDVPPPFVIDSPLLECGIGRCAQCTAAFVVAGVFASACPVCGKMNVSEPLAFVPKNR